jgi:hypothetical protein
MLLYLQIRKSLGRAAHGWRQHDKATTAFFLAIRRSLTSPRFD